MNATAFVPYGRQSIDESDIAAVVATLRSDFLTQGPAPQRFGAALAARAGVAACVVASSATAALHVACRALDLGPGGLLWTTPNTFVATANAALYCGADVDFVDIDPRTRNMSVDALAAKLAEARRKPDVIAPVHFAGRSCDMAAIGSLARTHGVRVIEDASHAIGATLDGRPVGACTHSEIVVYSFHPVKIVTTAEGGAALTNDPTLADRLGLFVSHGVTREPRLMVDPPEGPWDYDQVELGFNYRMTDLQAALGLSQLERLEGFVARRAALARRYDQLLDGLPLITPERDDARFRSAWHLYVVELADPAADRRAVFERMRAAGIGVNVHYIPVHTQPFYRKLGFRSGEFPNAERYYARALTLPLHPGLSEADQSRVVDVLARALDR